MHSGMNTCCSSRRACSWVYFLSATHLDTSAEGHRAQRRSGPWRRPAEAARGWLGCRGLTGRAAAGGHLSERQGPRGEARPGGKSGVSSTSREPGGRGSEKPLGLTVVKSGLYFLDSGSRVVPLRATDKTGTQGPPPERMARPCATWGPRLRASVRISPGMLARAWEGRRPGAQSIWPAAAALGPAPSASTLVHPAGSSSASEFLMISERHQLLCFQPRVENRTVSQIRGSNVFIRPPG